MTTNDIRHTIVVGLGLGDESKGATVDHLCATRDVGAVVRFSGGPQTLHHVVLPDGRVHGFSQFGSGTLRGLPTIHTRFSLINPLNMAREAQHLTDEFDIKEPFVNVIFDSSALMITPIHRAVNRAQEIARGDSRHGSCGQGVGVAQKYALDFPEDAPQMSDLYMLDRLEMKLERMFYRLVTDDVYEQLDATISEMMSAYRAFQVEARPALLPTDQINMTISTIGSGAELIFEGTQGVLLDEWYGFHPHTTWSTTTFENAETVLREAGFEREQWVRLGLTRAYTTRHGAGPLPGEDPTLLEDLPELHNGTGVYQGSWRVAPLQLPLLRYAAEVCGGVDEIGVSHLDLFPAHSDGETGRGLPVTMHYDDGDLVAKPDVRRDDLKFQKRLTKQLTNMSSDQMTTGKFDADYLLLRLEVELGAPVTLTAYGPTSEDRSYERADVPSPA